LKDTDDCSQLPKIHLRGKSVQFAFYSEVLPALSSQLHSHTLSKHVWFRVLCVQGGTGNIVTTFSFQRLKNRPKTPKVSDDTSKQQRLDPRQSYVPKQKARLRLQGFDLSLLLRREICKNARPTKVSGRFEIGCFDLTVTFGQI